MRSKNRRTPQPLVFTPDFTPDETKARRSEDKPKPVHFGPPPSPRASAPKRRSSPAGTDTALRLGHSPRKDAPPLGWAQYAYGYAALAAFTWAALLFTFTIGYVGGFSGLTRAPMQLGVVMLMAVLPGVFIFAAAGAIRQGARLAAEAHWARALAEDLVTPAALAAVKTGEIASAVREEVERAAAAATAAQEKLISVRETLAGERERLTEAAVEAQHVARAVGETLERERGALSGLLAALSSQADTLAIGVERQTRMVGEASDLARSQLQEAEATLASGAERLASAAADTSSVARGAGDSLLRQSERLDTAAAALSERLRFLDTRLNEQRHALSNLLSTLETDEEDAAARLESKRAAMLDVIAEARASAAELGDAASTGGEALRALIDGALVQTREVGAAARAEQALLREEAAEARLQAQNELHRSLDSLARLGEDARRALAAAGQDTEAAARARMSAAQREVEQLGELAFTAGQRADQAFQARLGETRRLIAEAAGLVEDAGVKAGERIEAGLGASRGALGELASALGDIDAQLARLPETARGHAEAVRASVERSLAEVTASARRAAEETQGLDAAFQDRVRRNYETLSEAVRLMGRVAGSVDLGRDGAALRAAGETPPKAAPAPQPPAPQPAPAAEAARPVEPPRAEPSRPEPAARPSSTPQLGAPRLAPTQPIFGRAAARAAEPAVAAGPADALLEPEPAAPSPAPAETLRPRLRFTPTEADQALKAVFEPRTASSEPEAATSARAAPGRDGWDSELDEWTWKDLLTSMDKPPAQGDALSEQMIREIETLGVDASALLPRPRLEELAESFAVNDAPAARDAVRRIAPAAIRRLSRRVLTDRTLRDDVDRYVDRYKAALRQSRSPADVTDVLADDAGRAYLLLEAAVGDL